MGASRSPMGLKDPKVSRTPAPVRSGQDFPIFFANPEIGLFDRFNNFYLCGIVKIESRMKKYPRGLILRFVLHLVGKKLDLLFIFATFLALFSLTKISDLLGFSWRL